MTTEKLDLSSLQNNTIYWNYIPGKVINVFSGVPIFEEQSEFRIVPIPEQDLWNRTLLDTIETANIILDQRNKAISFAGRSRIISVSPLIFHLFKHLPSFTEYQLNPKFGNGKSGFIIHKKRHIIIQDSQRDDLTTLMFVYNGSDFICIKILDTA